MRALSQIRDKHTREALLEIQLAMRKLQVKGNTDVALRITSGSMGFRRDVLANRGSSQAHYPEWFVEDRRSSSLGDQHWFTVVKSDGTYDWQFMGETT